MALTGEADFTLVFRVGDLNSLLTVAPGAASCLDLPLWCLGAERENIDWRRDHARSDNVDSDLNFNSW
jgi:hypothetical protein